MLSRLVEEKGALASPLQRKSLLFLACPTGKRGRKNAEEIIGRERLF